MGTENKVLKPIDQFRISLTEVSTGKYKGPVGSVFGKAAGGPTSIPPRNLKSNYLEKKRNSVFHKAFNSDSQQLKNFVPPVYVKSGSDETRLVKLYTSSFLTKNIDPKNHIVLAKAMYSKKFQADGVIIRYGDMGADYFVLAKGKVRVTVYHKGTDPDDPELAKKIAFEKVLEPKAAEQSDDQNP